MRKRPASAIRSGGCGNGSFSSSHGADWAGPSGSLGDFLTRLAVFPTGSLHYLDRFVLIARHATARLIVSGKARRSLCHVRHGVILLANQYATRREPILAP
jgi:hypothetical protein